MKTINPYQRLLGEIQSYCSKLYCLKTKNMWVYPKGKLNDTWMLTDLYERTAAAEQLGYDIILKATEQGLEVNYREKIPDISYPWK